MTAPRVCARFRDGEGAHEIVELPLADGSRLVVDRVIREGRPALAGDVPRRRPGIAAIAGVVGAAPAGMVHRPRLVARLDPGEPSRNADIVCAHYLADRRRRRTHTLAREVGAADFRTGARHGHRATAFSATRPLHDPTGGEHRLRRTCGARTAIPQLRWVVRRPGGSPRVECLREVIASMQSYEPALATSAAAVRRRAGDRTVSVAVLRAEVGRIQRSRRVLNRRLRERVLSAVAEGEVSMSEVAIRCGRFKRDERGRVSGETSWLARRLGLLPESGESRPTPWIHSDVLALIARAGLGMPPHEVEL